jgi:hypothetical protein
MRALAFHEPDCGLGTEKRPRQVDVDHRLPLCDGEVFECHGRRASTGIVEQHVDPPEGSLDGIEQFPDGRFVHDVGRNCDRSCRSSAVGDERGRFVERVSPTSGQNHIESIFGQLEGHRPANPRTSPGNHSDAHSASFARDRPSVAITQAVLRPRQGLGRNQPLRSSPMVDRTIGALGCVIVQTASSSSLPM